MWRVQYNGLILNAFGEYDGAAVSFQEALSLFENKNFKHKSSCNVMCAHCIPEIDIANCMFNYGKLLMDKLNDPINGMEYMEKALQM